MEKPASPGFAVLYRWTLKSGMDEQFVESWSEVTEALRRRGSLGARLHKGPDGVWFSYAQWPDAQARDRAFAIPLGTPAVARLREAIAETLPEIVLEPVADWLVLPPDASA
jgi:hypothetical protein